MLEFKDSQTQALRRLAVIANTDSLLKKPLHEFCDRVTNFNQLKRRKL